ncbi:MAG TPA: hypothetical protein VGI64_23815 [Streptosporangiaceae bacterium]
MCGNDQLTDSAELRALEDSMSGVTMPGRPRLAAITARGSARRRHRLAAISGLSVAGVAAGAVLALNLAGAHGQHQVPGTIRTAAYTLTSNANGTDALTINPGELFDPAALQSDLAQYGIPAKVTVGSYCSSDPAPSGFSQVVSGQPQGPSTFYANSGVQPTITIDPAAMPAGAALGISDFQLASGQQLSTMVLISAGSYSCNGTPPPAPSDGYQALYGGHTGP